MIYVYAIGEPADAPERPGLGGARLRVLTGDGIAAIYSRHRTLRPRPSPAALWAHEAIVEELMRRGTALPLRFGTMLAGETALRAILAEHREPLAAGLERVRDRVELSVRVLGAPAPERPPPGTTGHAYLMARRAAHHDAQAAAEAVHEPLVALARDARLRAPAAPPALLAAAYLVDHQQVDAFKARVGALAAAREDLSIVGTGPWPPYSFVPELRL